MKNLLLLLALITFGACQKPGIDKDEIMKLTKQVNDSSLDGHLHKNADEVIRAYTPDAVILPPGGVKPIIGIENIRKYYEWSFAGPGRSLNILTETIRFDVVSENDATQLGSYNIQFQPSDTSKVAMITGEMLIVWKRVNNEWKIYLDMWH